MPELDAFAALPGVGEVKLERYDEAFVGVIRSFVAEQETAPQGSPANLLRIGEPDDVRYPRMSAQRV